MAPFCDRHALIFYSGTLKINLVDVNDNAPTIQKVCLRRLAYERFKKYWFFGAKRLLQITLYVRPICLLSPDCSLEHLFKLFFKIHVIDSSTHSLNSAVGINKRQKKDLKTCFLFLVDSVLEIILTFTSSHLTSHPLHSQLFRTWSMLCWWSMNPLDRLQRSLPPTVMSVSGAMDQVLVLRKHLLLAARGTQPI